MDIAFHGEVSNHTNKYKVATWLYNQPKKHINCQEICCVKGYICGFGSDYNLALKDLKRIIKEFKKEKEV